MSFRKTSIFALLLCGLLFYIWRVELPKEKARLAAEQVFPEVNKSDIRSIEVRRKGEEFTLENEVSGHAGSEANARGETKQDPDPKWKLAGIEKASVDKGAINSLLSTLVELKQSETIPREEMDTDLATYGLKEPAVELKVNHSGGDKVIKFGKLNEFVDMRYAMLGGKEEVFMIQEMSFASIDKGRDDFRSKNPVQFSDGELKAVELSHSDSTVKIERVSDADWKIVEPLKAPVDPLKFAEFTRNLRNLRAGGFVDSPDTKLSDYGLEAPELKISLKFADESKNPPLEIISARKSSPAPTEKGSKDAKSEVFFKLSDRPTIFKMQPDSVGALKLTADTIRERKLFQFAMDKVERVEFDSATDADVTLVKKDGAWTVNERPADEIFVRAVLDNLSRMEADAFPKVPHEYGFEKPRLRIVVQLASVGGKEGEKKTLLVGNAFKSEDLTKTAYYASAGQESEPFIISEDTFRKIFFREEALARAPSESIPESKASESAPQESKESNTPISQTK